MVEIRPQTGPQETFLSSPADIAIYGGAAGGGKSWALLIEPLRHATSNSEFTAVFFRRNAVQVKNPGGLWDESIKIYPSANGVPLSHVLQWDFPDGGTVKFGHLEHEHTVLNWQGSQIPLICFDELTHFSEQQFFYMLSRNRSMCGVRPYVRATTNPDADSWVAEFIAWWINQETGFPIPERSGKLRWFIRINDELVWADSAEELTDKYGPQVMPKSVTFIAASIYDNKKLMEVDPGYLANLMALDSVQRERLLEGNWKVRKRLDGMFMEKWLKFTEIRPATLNVYIVCDPASSKKKTSDNTAIAVIGVDYARNKYLLDGFCHKMNLRERWLAVRGMRRKWRGAQGVQGVFVGYEKYGMQSDIEYFQEQMDIDKDVFDIRELNWAKDSGQSKPDRVQRLVPDFLQGRFYLAAIVMKEVEPGKWVPAESAKQAEMRQRGEPYRILTPPKQRDHEGNLYGLNKKFVNEFVNFPSPNFPDDLIDAVSRIYDMDYQPPVVYDQAMEAMLEPEVE
jgi:hypothetical protein